MPGPLLAVDAPSLLYRAFHALPDSIAAPDGTPVNALLGTANVLLLAIDEHRPRAVVLCFGAEAAAYRAEAFAPYHADRPPMPEALAAQWELAPAFFGAFGWSTLDAGDLEADDLLGTLARLEEEAGGRALLLTGDRDMFQCASGRTTVLYLKTGTKGYEPVGPEQVRERYGVDPQQVPDFIALRGDPSDGLPGARGIGEKTAASLLRRHGSLEGVLAACAEEPPRTARALAEAAEILPVFWDIARLRTVPVERPDDAPTDYATGAAAARRLGMNRLADRLGAKASAPGLAGRGS